LKSQKIDAALTTALQEAGVTSIQTALKLMDKSNIVVNDDGTVSGVSTAMDDLKRDHAIVLTQSAIAPDPARASEDHDDVNELDLTKLDMKNPADREKYKKYRKSHGLAN